MRYLNPGEIQNSGEAEECLSGYISQSIKHNFALETLEKYAPNKNAKILDAGCASGAFLKQLSERGYQELYGLDLSNYLASGVRFRDFKSADFNIDIVPYPDDCFDAITAWCVVAHLENPYHFIRETARILKKDGLFLFSLPHTGSSSERLNFYRKGEFIAYKPNNNHIAIWTPSLLGKTTSKYFEIAGKEFLLKNKIFRGWKGGLRQWYYQFNPSIARRWGSKIVYILKKR